ncbi:MAG: hypothetical protein DYG89_15260 [Caldilinea sp. CFX5]|nr:hypothetical protein [Caldilinea sp. CFX5]
MNKPLTLSQQQHLIALGERQAAAARAVAEFIEYLRDEHGASPAEGWTLRDIQTGFVLPPPPPKGEMKGEMNAQIP